MRLLRFITLLVALLLVYGAQYVFDHRTLVDFFPQWFLDTFPTFYTYTRWLPDDLLTLAWGMALLGSVSLGLTSTEWLGPVRRSLTPPEGADSLGTRVILGGIWLILAIGVGGYLVGYLLLGFGESILVQALWLASLALYLVGCVWISQRTPMSPARAFGALHFIRPERGWRFLLLILLIASVLFGWQLTAMPVRIDEAEAQHGLEALALARGERSHLFASAETGLPVLAYIPAATGIWLTQDGLLGGRLSGLVSGLFVVVSTWLLGCELFRRSPRLGPYETVLEDDGRWPALTAAALVAGSHVLMHFSRLPVYIGPVAWGGLGCWALLRGLRTNDRLALGVSGMLVGWASISYASGLTFLLIVPIWWCGVWLLRRTWLQTRYQGVGWLGAAIWLGGLFVVLAPLLGAWAQMPGLFSAYRADGVALTPTVQARLTAMSLAQPDTSFFWQNLRLTLLTFNVYPNTSSLFAFAGPLLNSVLAPLFLLSIGVLLLNLDRLPGWLLLTWLGCEVMAGSLAPDAPYWPRLLPIVPAVALAVAFTFDRIRLTLLESAGTWLEQTSLYLFAGIVIWAGLTSWVAYYDYALRHSDSISYLARGLRDLPAEQVAVLIVPEQTAEEVIRPTLWDTPAIRFLADQLTNAQKGGVFTVAEWPQPLAPSSRLFIHPDAENLLISIEQEYPSGQLTRLRGLRGDVILYVYDLEK